MGIKVANNAFGTLASSITNSATSITLTTGQGSRFPTLGAGDYFYATLIDTTNNLEIVKCTARSTDVLTVTRAQENTTARAYSAGDRIEIRITAATFEDATAVEDGEVTAAKLASGAAVSNIGYTPVNKAGDTISGDLEVDGVLYVDGGGGGPSVTLRNGGDIRLQNAANSGSVHVYCDNHGVLTVGGKLNPTVGTPNGCSNASAITINTSTPTVIASTTITTNGYPVLLTCSGDQNPNQAGGWHYVQFAVDNIAIGKRIINENAGGASKNCPFALTHIHQPPAGTYTFQVRAWQGSGSMTYGEEGDVQAPTITAVEIR